MYYIINRFFVDERKVSLQMLTLILSAYSLGTFDTSFEKSHLNNISQFAQRRVVYTGFQAYWTLNDIDLQRFREQLNLMKNSSTVPFIQWDPMLPINNKDSMEAILAGLHDDYIDKFYQLLSNFETETNLSAIILVGAHSNESPSFSANQTLFKLVFQKFVVDAKKYNLRAKFGFGISASACDGPEPTYEPCEGWYVDEDGNIQYCTEDGRLIEPTVNSTQNDYRSTKCNKSIQDLYPGDSYVSWIAVHAMNDRLGVWQPAADLIHKGMFAASLASNNKPIMLIVGSRSDEVESKSKFIRDMQKWTSYYSSENPWWNQRISGLMLNNREGNFDTGFYNSLQGDTVTSQSNNGVELYSYEALSKVFKEDINAAGILEVSEINVEVAFEAAFIGALCSAGSQGDLNSGACRPCPAGHFQTNVGKDVCDQCPLNTYNEDVGQIKCIECPQNGTTIHPGAARKDYCQCQLNYYKIDDEDCVPCPRNQYSHAGGDCIACPKDAQFSGGKGKPGQGCFCKNGFEWKGKECAVKDSAGAIFGIIGTLAVIATVLI